MKSPKDCVILVVDDEEILRQIIAKDFKRKGYQVLLAANGKEALEVVKSNPVDLVISDVRMGSGDGLELLVAVKALCPKAPVMILMTGFADVSLEDVYDLGADAMVNKPFERAALSAAVEKALAARNESWAPRAEPGASGFKVELSFPALNSAIEAKKLNIGRGGLFVGLSASFPAVGEAVRFKFTFAEGAPRVIEGAGRVRWVRTAAAGAYPPGCGIEITVLEDSCREEVVAWLDERAAKAFIPKT